MTKLNPDKVNAIISDFEAQPPQDLPLLMEWARVLSTQYYWYCKALGEVSKQYRNVRANRKRKRAELIQRYNQTENSVTAATAKAEAHPEYLDLYDKESALEGTEQSGRRHCDSIEKVIDRMNQEIAELRKEREYIRHTEGKQ